MATSPNTPFNISRTSQGAFLDYYKQIARASSQVWNLKDRMRQVDLAFARETDRTEEHTRAKIANRAGNTDKLQNITVPIVKPYVRSAVSYQAAVFLEPYPMFEVVSDPMYVDQAKQLQAVLEENAIRGAWAREFLLFFYDGFKYDISAVEADWHNITVPDVTTDTTYLEGKEGRPGTSIWQGNRITRWDPYNMFWDTKVIPYDVPTMGEYAGRTMLLTKTALKNYIQKLPNKILENLPHAFNSSTKLSLQGSGETGTSFFIPEVNSEAIVDQKNVGMFDWDSYLGLKEVKIGGVAVQYKDVYELTYLYVRILPIQFDLKVPARSSPQIWKLHIVNHEHIVGIERLTNAHEKIPVFFGCPAEDGLNYQSKSFASDAKPFQEVTSGLLNSIMASRRRAATDRALYDPSRVLKAHIENPNPSAKIPVRPQAYGKPVSESVYQFPFRDDQAGTAMQEIQALTQLGDRLLSQNQARQGQFVKGNKTNDQWESTMAGATSADQLTALLYEAQVFTPLKEVLKYNTIQYQPKAAVYSNNQQKQVNIDPIALRQAILQFKITDGKTPKEKVMSSEATKIAMQVIGSSEILAGQYNIGPMFSYIMKTENVALEQFQKSQAQIAYEQASAQWSQLAQIAIQKEQPFNVPQPKPADFGWNPESINPQSQIPQAQESLQDGTN
jgi:hypothetical protein